MPCYSALIVLNKIKEITLCDAEPCQKLLKKIDSLDVGKKLKNMERQLMDLLYGKFEMLRKQRVTNLKKTYAAVVAVEITEGKPKGGKKDENSRNYNVLKRIRIQGIPEDPNKKKAENLVPRNPTNDEVKDLLDSIFANTHTTEIQRHGKFRNDRKTMNGISNHGKRTRSKNYSSKKLRNQK